MRGELHASKSVGTRALPRGATELGRRRRWIVRDQRKKMSASATAMR